MASRKAGLRLAEHHDLGPYLTQRANLVRDLATQVHATASTGDTPAWGRSAGVPLEPALLGDLAVWRATIAVAENDDPRPTGPAQHDKNAAHWQHHLNTRVMDAAVATTRTLAIATARGPETGPRSCRASTLRPPAWSPTTSPRSSPATSPTWTPAGSTRQPPLNQALMIDPLPDDHAAAALWWRIQSQLTPVEIHLNTPSEDFAHQRPLSGAAHDR